MSYMFEKPQNTAWSGFYLKIKMGSSEGLYFRVNLANIMDGVRLFLKCPHLWRSGTTFEGQKLYTH